jgi:hypothetical protein
LDSKKQGFLVIYNLDHNSSQNIEIPQFDVCIIGAGAAGITLANKLDQENIKVCLCEGGSETYSEESQEIYKGNNIGDHYFNLDVARLRFLGGSTNHWNGLCRSFEEIDFNRGYLGEEYRWPITYDEIFKYHDESCKILEIDNNFEYLEKNKQDKEIRKITFKFSPPVRFNEKYRNKIDESKNIILFLNANLLDIEGENKLIKSAKFESFSKKQLKIKANVFIFAMGGIENSRFLLWFKEKYNSKFYDKKIPIGKYWMEHPNFTLGSAIVDKSITDSIYFSINPNIQINKKILNCGFRINKITNYETKKLVKELLCIAPKFGNKVSDLLNKKLVCGAGFFASWEQSPNIYSNITLARTFDKFNIPRINLNWKKNSLDRKTLMESINTFNNWLMDEELGRIHLHKWVNEQSNYPQNDEIAGYHHMGGTRMHKNPSYGVVDENCKVHGSKNLYVIGSSIFTTGGHNNPTLPIVQFTLRLADHLIKTKT